MIKEILFVHHSHTDIGYTHPQPVVMELHRRFIDEALDIAEATADYPDDAKFRSCLTLFAEASDEALFRRGLDRFFDGSPDPATLDLLHGSGER